jgi:hypothetical protein
MPRQQSQSLASVSSLRGVANTLRSAVKENLPDAMNKIANGCATAFEGAQTAIEGLEQRLRQLGEPNVSDPAFHSPLLVSGDRIRNGMNVQGGLGVVRGQSLDLTFEKQVATVASFDHVASKYMPLVLAGAGVVLDTHTTAPVNSAAPGTDGEIRMDNGYIYIHSGGSWRRAALSTF